MFEIFEHTADLGLRVRADQLNELFTDAAAGLFSMIVVNLNEVDSVQEKVFRLSADQTDLLLLDWLSELLYTFDAEHLLLSKFQVQADERQLEARCWGDRLDLSRHQVDHEVKAITYHGLLVQPSENGWLAEVIVDI